jgi:prepilin-type N-terminal cleavage/methylation domain-containing protein
MQSPPPDRIAHKSALSAGFTLIELSIVLVVIGLIVGGVLVGQDMIKAAAVRAQITQIEKFNDAVNTFYGKYTCLPGDCANAATFGFPARGPYPGQGDGNGIIQGNRANASWSNNGIDESAGETTMFWVDLSMAGFIAGSFTTASSTVVPGADVTGTAINNWLPQAQLGGGNYVLVFSNNGANFFQIEPVTTIIASAPDGVYSGSGITVQQAYAIDTKIDDGQPETGNVLAQYVSTAVVFHEYDAGPPTYPAIPSSATRCYDNTSPTNSGGNAGQPTAYALDSNGISNTNQPNCTLSFRMQGAAR